jgi:sugar lactone lactonase YvrE
MHRRGSLDRITLLVCLGLILATLSAAAGVALAAAGDVAADRELGQPDFAHNASNIVDAEAMNSPNMLAVDKSVTPNRIYVVDESNNRVLGYASVTALVNGGSASIVIGQPDFFSTNCNTNPTSLCDPRAVAVDKLGNIYVADHGNNRAVEFPKPFSSGMLAGMAATMVWGQGLDFYSNQCNFGFSNPGPTQESMCGPAGVAFDSAGDLFVADTGNNRVVAFKVPFNPATNADIVYGQAGSFTTNKVNLGNSSPANATLSGPTGLAVDASNDLYIVDTGNNRVLEYKSPLTNSTTANSVFGQSGSFTQGACNASSFAPTPNTLCSPGGVLIDATNNVYIADSGNNRVLIYNPPIASNPAANAVLGQTGLSSNSCNNNQSTPSNTTLCNPQGIGLDSSTPNNLWVADRNNNRMLKYPSPLTSGKAATVALGQPDFAHNSPNHVDPTGLDAPGAIAIDMSATPNHLYVVDTNNNRVLGYTNAATFTNNAPANLVIGQLDFYSSGANQNSSPGASTLSGPLAAIVDASGNLFVADGGNNRVLEYANPFKSGQTANQAAIAVFGQGGSFTSNAAVCPPNAATATGMCLPSGLAIDLRTGNGNLYVSDKNNSRVLRFKPPFPASPAPNLVIGQANVTANACNRNPGVPFVFPSAATLCNPDQIAVDSAGNLYVADTDNSRVLEYAAPSVNGVAASHIFGQLGNFTSEDCNLDAPDVNVIDADSLCAAEGVASNSSGNLYIADTANNRVLGYTTPLTSSSATVVFGQGEEFTNNQCNFGTSVPSAKTLCAPLMAAVDSLGNLYVADTNNNRVLEYDKPDPPAIATPTPTPKRTPAPTPKPTSKPTPTPKGGVSEAPSQPQPRLRPL